MAKSRPRSEALDFDCRPSRPRAPRLSRPRRTVNMVIYDDQYEAMREICFRKRTKLSSVVRDLLDDYIAREGAGEGE